MTDTVISPPSADDRRRRRRKRLLVTVAAVVLVLGALAGAGIWYFFRDDAPDAVTLDNATQSVSTEADPAPVNSTGGSTGAPSVDGIAGSWAVDTSQGTFSFEDSTGTFVGFRIKEKLSGIGDTTAVGRTPKVSGTITIDGTTLTAASIEADMKAITTNDNRRNSKVQSALETSTFPTATFVLTQPIELGDNAATGAAVDVDATGQLTIHGVTKTVTLPLQAKLVGDTVVVVGSLEITFADYGVSVPDAPIVVSAEDHGVIEMQLLFTKG